MSTETKLVLRRFPLQVKDGQPLSSLPRPSTHDLETTRPLESASVEDQVAYFRSQLKLESQMRKQQRDSAAAEASAYRAQAQDIHVVEGREINIFAPFVMERSALK